MKNFFFIHWQSLYKAGLWSVIFVPFGLETSDTRKPAKFSARAAGTQIKLFLFLFLWFLVWPSNNILLTELGRSVWENLDVGRWYSPRCVWSVQRDLGLGIGRPPARLIRTKYRSTKTDEIIKITLNKACLLVFHFSCNELSVSIDFTGFVIFYPLDFSRYSSSFSRYSVTRYSLLCYSV